ncbi:MAG TPA: 3-dehydroquinate synthase [Thermoanaerobaculia bacterium]|nr:3-dehydroquinate synthase [Thermoanaerobaculia bacterium]
MIELALRHPAGVCPALVGEGLLGGEIAALTEAVSGRTVFVVSSPPVRALHGEPARGSLAAAVRVIDLDVADGEAAKTVAEAERLWSEMLEAGGKRDSAVVALGGGSVGDLAGFVAATFLRGIRLVQIPTTLLAQVDASVGGKTGIDLPAGKNTVGAFHQPALVVADVATLATLEEGELRSGLFEVVKKGVILDHVLLETVERDLDALLRARPRELEPVVAAAIAAKARIVEQDPFEEGRRRLLNFGHTLGHAIETCLGYRGLRHGEAVGHGMLFALELARERGMSEEDARRVGSLIQRIGLPPLPELSADALWEALGRDKKAREEGLAWVLPCAIGSGEIVALDATRVRASLERFLLGRSRRI